MSATAAATPDTGTDINLFNLVWVALALAVMTGVIFAGDAWALNFLHVLCGVLWTGIDLFMGFVVGPVMRRLPPPARRAMVLRMMPKMLFLLPTLSIITGTTGWYHAKMIGLLDLPWPQFGWVAAALAIVAVLTVQGIGVLLPTNLMVYFEMRREIPDGARIGRLMRRFVYAVALQGVLQVAIIAVMARFVTGL